MPLDMSLATAPPRKGTSGTSGRKTATPKTQPVPETTSNLERRANGLAGLGQLVQAGCLMFGQYADAAAIGQHFNPIAVELAKIADSNEAVAKPIDFLIEVGPYGALVTAVLPMALQIAANHGWVDASRLMGQGVMPPAVLDAQMRTQVMQMQAEAVRAQNAALAAAQEAQKEFEAALREQNQAE